MSQQSAHRYEDRLLDFAYGELPAAEARSIEVHLKGCARCTGALREIEGVRRQMSQLAAEPAPDAGLESLLAYAQQAARRVQAGPASQRGVRRWLYGLAGTASLAAVLLVVGVVANLARPELAPMSPEALRRDAVKEELAGGKAAATPAPAPPVQPDVSGWADGAARPQGPENKAPVADLPQEPAAEVSRGAAQAAGARRKKNALPGDERRRREDGQRSIQDYKLSTREDPMYRQAGPDMLDRGQNFVPGRGTRPVLPTTRAPEAARLKSAPLPADGEMMFPSKSKGGVTRRSKAPGREPLPGSGFGFDSAPEVVSGAGGSVAPAQSEDERQAPELPTVVAGAERMVQAPAESLPEALVAQSPPRETSRAAEDDAFGGVAKDEVAKKVARAPSIPAGTVSSLRDAPASSATPPPSPQVAGAALSTAMAPAAQLQVRAQSARELYAAAGSVRAGSTEEIDSLIAALGAGLSGRDRLDALRRLCTHLESRDDERAYDYCTAWANADPGSALANKRAREAEVRWSARKAKARAAEAVDSLEPSPASPAQKAEPAVKY